MSESVLGSVERFLERRELEGDEEVLAAVARALASQLDAAVEAGSARGLSACPPLARRLVDVIGVFGSRVAAEAAWEAQEAERRAVREQRQREALGRRTAGDPSLHWVTQLLLSSEAFVRRRASGTAASASKQQRDPCMIRLLVVVTDRPMSARV